MKSRWMSIALVVAVAIFATGVWLPGATQSRPAGQFASPVSSESPMASPAGTAESAQSLIGAGPVGYYNARTDETYSVVVTDMLASEAALEAITTATGETFASQSSIPIRIVEERRLNGVESEMFAMELTDTGIYPDAMVLLTTEMEGKPGLAIFAVHDTLFFSFFGSGLSEDTLPFLRWALDLVAHNGDAPVVPEWVIAFDL